MPTRRPPLKIGDTTFVPRSDLFRRERTSAVLPATALGDALRADPRSVMELYDRIAPFSRSAVTPPTPDDVDDARREVERALRHGELVGLRRDVRLRGDERLVLGDEPVAEAPPPGTIPEEKTTWFEATIVDAARRPVGGLGVALSAAGERKNATTNGSGIVRFEQVAASTGSLRIGSVKQVKDALAARPPAAPEPALKDADTLRLVVGHDDLVASLHAEAPRTIVLVEPLSRVRLIGMHFDTNKSFMRPSALRGIRAVSTICEQHPTENLLVVGHTDTAGSDQYNLDLSLERAQTVVAYLRKDVAAWEGWFDDGKPSQKRWGDHEVALMISALPCDQSVSGFQSFSNDTRGTDLAVDGIAGPRTRHALIAAYMDVEGTAIPDGTNVEEHGCGEYFPIEPTGDNVADEENRRVEIFCFEGPINPPVPGPEATPGEPEYDEWRKRVTTTIDVSDAGLQVIVLDDDDAPLEAANVKVEGPVVATAATDATGAVHFVGLAHGDYSVTAERPGHRTRSTTAHVPLKSGAKEVEAEADDGKEKPTPTSDGEPAVVLQLAKVVEIVVFVRDEAGSPLVGARVRFRDPELPPEYLDVRVTDVFGRAALPLDNDAGLSSDLTVAVTLSASDSAEDAAIVELHSFVTNDKTLTIPASALAAGGKLLPEARRVGMHVETVFFEAKRVVARIAPWQSREVRKIRYAGEPEPIGKVETNPDGTLKKNPDGTLKLPPGPKAPLPTARTAKLVDFLCDMTDVREGLGAGAAIHPILLSKSHQELIEEVVKVFEQDDASPTPLLPPWLRYGVMHFSGMLYRNANGSVMPPDKLLAIIRRREFEEEAPFDDVPKPVPKVAKLTEKEGDRLLAQWLLEAKGLLDADKTTIKKEQDVIAEVRSHNGVGIEPSLAKCTAGDPAVYLSGLSTANRNAAQAALREFIKRYWTDIRVKRIPPEHQLGILVALGVGGFRGPDRAFDIDIRRFVHSRTELICDMSEPPDAPPKDGPVLEAFPGSARWKAMFADWMFKQLPPVYRGGAAEGWRDAFREDQRPRVSFAVCDQIDEMMVKLRGVDPDGGLTAHATLASKTQPLKHYVDVAQATDGLPLVGSFVVPSRPVTVFYLQWLSVGDSHIDEVHIVDPDGTIFEGGAPVEPDDPSIGIRAGNSAVLGLRTVRNMFREGPPIETNKNCPVRYSIEASGKSTPAKMFVRTALLPTGATLHKREVLVWFHEANIVGVRVADKRAFSVQPAQPPTGWNVTNPSGGNEDYIGAWTPTKPEPDLSRWLDKVKLVSLSQPDLVEKTE